MGIAVRPFRAGDGQAVAELFVATVRGVNARDYDAAQIAAWSAAGADPDRWEALLPQRASFVAEIDAVVAGFADATATGCFDHLFVHRDHQGEGVGTALADAVEAAVRERGAAEVWAEVSITARPFFARRGYRVLRAQRKPAGGLSFRNDVMVKTLAGA
jgi:putative acetyltransferase